MGTVVVGAVWEMGIAAVENTTKSVIKPTTMGTHTAGFKTNAAIVFPNPDIALTVPGALKIPLINPACPRFLSS